MFQLKTKHLYKIQWKWDTPRCAGTHSWGHVQGSSRAPQRGWSRTGFCRNGQQSEPLLLEEESHLVPYPRLRPTASVPLSSGNRKSLTQDSKEQRPQDGEIRRGVLSCHLEMIQRRSSLLRCLVPEERWATEAESQGVHPRAWQGSLVRGIPEGQSGPGRASQGGDWGAPQIVPQFDF